LLIYEISITASKGEKKYLILRCNKKYVKACDVNTHIFFTHSSNILIQTTPPPEGHFPQLTTPKAQLRKEERGSGAEKPLRRRVDGDSRGATALQRILIFLLKETGNF
jgi:hypothetical protein